MAVNLKISYLLICHIHVCLYNHLPFKNINTLEEAYCLKITKWTKKLF